LRNISGEPEMEVVEPFYSIEALVVEAAVFFPNDDNCQSSKCGAARGKPYKTLTISFETE
jgi:hypothetical protein